MFEFAFMPIILPCADDKKKFEELFPRETINLFVQTFFGRIQPMSRLRVQVALEGSSLVFYEQFHIEIMKALSVILKQSDDPARLDGVLRSSD